jgi:hypothetical protein
MPSFQFFTDNVNLASQTLFVGQRSEIFSQQNFVGEVIAFQADRAIDEPSRGYHNERITRQLATFPEERKSCL